MDFGDAMSLHGGWHSGIGTSRQVLMLGICAVMFWIGKTELGKPRYAILTRGDRKVVRSGFYHAETRGVSQWD